jgi:serine/threonine protein kinase
MSQDSLLPPATRERHYSILVELGRGGTSDVYLAVVDGSGGFTSWWCSRRSSPRDRARPRGPTPFPLGGAPPLGPAEPPHVVQVNEVIEQAGIPIIVMEYLEGRFR